jgi:hypothetical protein
LEELLAAPTFVEINGTRLWFDPSVWGNGMPYIGPADHPDAPSRGLHVYLVVRPSFNSERLHRQPHPRNHVAAPHPPLPKLEFEHAWLMFGALAWSISSAEPIAHYLYQDAALAAGTRVGRPKGPFGGDFVAVIRIRDENGETYLIRAEPRRIMIAY